MHSRRLGHAVLFTATDPFLGHLLRSHWGKNNQRKAGSRHTEKNAKPIGIE
jgi:hypothetical protein